MKFQKNLKNNNKNKSQTLILEKIVLSQNKKLLRIMINISNNKHRCQVQELNKVITILLILINKACYLNY